MLQPAEPIFALQQERMTPQYDLVCLSHLRWNFVYQRPHHLLHRCAQERRVFFIEEPMFDADDPYLHISTVEGGIWIIVPHLPQNISEERANVLQSQLIDELFARRHVNNYVLWYYTPMALPFTNHLEALAVVYDCMDELSAFKGAPSILRQREAELFQYTDLVFTGGQSLYEAKRQQHRRVHAFPSSVDTPHFMRARNRTEDPADQASIPHPRLGFYGVIDERMDLALLSEIADMQPNWHLVLVGPVAKIGLDTLPQRQNIHYLGGKAYDELPTYLSGWDVALLPFVCNESTRFISPTKTPEYLAGGKPVVSTSIHDVVFPYGEQGLVYIADTASDFVAAVKEAMNRTDPMHLQKVDTFLSQTSWDRTWNRMRRLIDEIVVMRQDLPSYAVALRLSQSILHANLSSSGGLE